MSSPHPLRLMTHNRQWEQDFLQAKSMLLWATEGWLHAVEHIGSTSLTGSIAQPVIDMLGGLPDLQGLNQATELIEGLNYQRVASPDWCADELTALLRKPRVGLETHTILLVKQHGRAWQRALAIRDWLASHLHDLQCFQNLKRDHYDGHCDALTRYTQAKSGFFQLLEARMLA